MRKFTLAFFTGLLFIVACQKNDSPQEDVTAAEAVPEKRYCAADEVLQAQLAEDPSLGDRMAAIERFTRKAIESGAVSRLDANGNIVIPVVVHVVYRTNQENIPDAQIQSQIDVLTEDFNLDNPDHRQVPAAFSGVKANVGVTFELAQVMRKKTNKKSWGTNDAVKFTSRGGSDAVDPAHNLNIWVCNLGQGLLGYAQFPGGQAATDGVVVGYFCFGRVGSALQPPFHKGRTATHEVGHWLNLRHIWGDANCGNDLVGDTPQHNTANYGCPSYPHYSTCAGRPLEMTMNYMDYTDDPCMYMFSNGQKDRMLAVFAAGGPRAGFAQ